MSPFHKFCCLCTIRSGALFSGFYTVVSTLIFIGIILLRFVGYNLISRSSVHEAAFYAIMAMDGCLSMVSVLLIAAVFKDMPRLMLPWVVTMVTSIVTVTIMVVWVMVVQIQDTKIQNTQLESWDIIILGYHTFNSIFELYCIMCVTTQILDLLKGKGTAEWYRHRRFMRMVHAHRHLSRMASNDLMISAEDDIFPDDIDNIGINIPPATPTTPPPYTQAPPDYSTMPRPGENQPRPTANQVLSPQPEEQGQSNPALVIDNENQNNSTARNRSHEGQPRQYRGRGVDNSRHRPRQRPRHHRSRNGGHHHHQRPHRSRNDAPGVNMGPVPVLLDPMMAARLYDLQMTQTTTPTQAANQTTQEQENVATTGDNNGVVVPPADYDSNSALANSERSQASDPV